MSASQDHAPGAGAVRVEGAPRHTPGPWGYTLGQVMRVTTKDAKAVCGIHRIGAFSARGGDPEEWAANARLIAAAPDLLASSQAFLRAAAQGRVSVETDRALRAAIAKALGAERAPLRAAQTADDASGMNQESGG